MGTNLAKGIAMTGSRENVESKSIHFKQTIFLKGTDENQIADTLKNLRSKKISLDILQNLSHTFIINP